MTATAPVLSDRLDALIEEEAEAFLARQPRSRAFAARARHLAGGVTSNSRCFEAILVSASSASLNVESRMSTPYFFSKSLRKRGET